MCPTMMKNKQREIKDVEKSIDEYVCDVARSFGEPYDDRKSRENSNPSLRSVANQWGVSICKARQILITAGVYSTYTSRYIQEQYKNGKSHREISQELGIGITAVKSYLPYEKRPYLPGVNTRHGDASALYRKRKAACEKLQIHGTDKALVEAIRLFSNYPFGNNISYVLDRKKLVFKDGMIIKLSDAVKMYHGDLKSDDNISSVFNRIGNKK